MIRLRLRFSNKNSCYGFFRFVDPIVSRFPIFCPFLFWGVSEKQIEDEKRSSPKNIGFHYTGSMLKSPLSPVPQPISSRHRPPPPHGDARSCARSDTEKKLVDDLFAFRQRVLEIQEKNLSMMLYAEDVLHDRSEPPSSLRRPPPTRGDARSRARSGTAKKLVEDPSDVRQFILEIQKKNLSMMLHAKDVFHNRSGMAGWVGALCTGFHAVVCCGLYILSGTKRKQRRGGLRGDTPGAFGRLPPHLGDVGNKNIR